MLRNQLFGLWLKSRLRVVSNFGDGDCGADEIHMRAWKFAPFASRLLEISRVRVYFVHPTIAIAKIRDYSQSSWNLLRHIIFVKTILFNPLLTTLFYFSLKGKCDSYVQLSFGGNTVSWGCSNSTKVSWSWSMRSCWFCHSREDGFCTLESLKPPERWVQYETLQKL